MSVFIFKDGHVEKDCWCKPEMCQPCPVCEMGVYGELAAAALRRGPPISDCWRCGGDGLVEPYDDDKQLIVVHKEQS